jgi:two-component system, response regulator PdtaR
MASYATERPLVLIVEDEYLIRTYAAEVIRDAGFEVVEASNADEAITILESRPDIRVVFTDVQMPGSMDGLKLAHAVRDRWPPVHIIATSGHYAFNKGDLPTGTVFLQKPYSQHQIASTLHTFTAPSGG